MNLRTLTLLLTLSVMAASSQGLDSDRYQPIRIQADAAMVDESRGTSIYRGNVIIHQGTLQVTADEVEIYTADNQVIQIIAKAAKDPGELAHYEQRTNDANDMVSAEARKITYLVQEERLHLAGNAKLQQVGDIFTGELLYYDLGRGIVNLDSGGSKGRVNMTISPKQPNN